MSREKSGGSDALGLVVVIVAVIGFMVGWLMRDSIQ